MGKLVKKNKCFEEGVTQEELDEMKQLILDTVFPIGSPYMSFTDSRNPNEILGFGEWKAIKGRFLLGANDNYVAGTEGGEEAHSITIDNLPAHTHKFTGTPSSHKHNFSNSGTKVMAQKSKDQTVGNVGFNQTSGAGSWIDNWGLSSIANSTLTPAGTNSSVGGDVPLNTMPPHIAVYMWKRIS